MVGTDGALPLPWLGGWLETALRTQRGHAVLIHGPQGIGQWQVSLALGQAWLWQISGHHVESMKLLGPQLGAIV